MRGFPSRKSHPPAQLRVASPVSKARADSSTPAMPYQLRIQLFSTVVLSSFNELAWFNNKPVTLRRSTKTAAVRPKRRCQMRTHRAVAMSQASSRETASRWRARRASLIKARTDNVAPDMPSTGPESCWSLSNRMPRNWSVKKGYRTSQP